VGVLSIKELIGKDIDQNKSLRDLEIKLTTAIIASPEALAIDLLREFKKGKSHMAFITDQVEDYQKKFEQYEKNSYGAGNILEVDKINLNFKLKSKILGIVTLENVIEKMINIEILNEDEHSINKLNESKSSKKSQIYKKKGITKEIAKSFIKTQGIKLNAIIESQKKITTKTSNSKFRL